MLLKDVYTPDVVCCARETHAKEAAELMRQRHVGDLVIVDTLDGNRIPVGVITDRDLVVEVMAQGLDPCKTRVGAIAKKPIVLASEDEAVSQAIERMRTHGIRRLPVVDDEGAIVGIVTFDDLLSAIVGEADALLSANAKEQQLERRERR